MDRGGKHHIPFVKAGEDAPKALQAPESRSTSLRRRSIARSCSHGQRRLDLGGATGVKPSFRAGWRVSSPSSARSMIRWHPGGAAQERTALWSFARRARRERKTQRAPSIRGNQMNLGGPAPAGFAEGLAGCFFSAPVPTGWTLMIVLSGDTASNWIAMICSCWRRANIRSGTPLYSSDSSGH